MTNPTADAVFRLDHVKTVAIFGAGRFGTSAAQLASRCGWTIGYWVDNNAKLWNTNVAGRPVRPAAALRESPVDLIVIASHANLDAIARQLEGLGFVHGVDFISFLAPVEVGDVQLRVTA
jgi:hypothetical protein